MSHHEGKRAICGQGEFDGTAYGPQVQRAGASRNQHEIGLSHPGADGLRNRWGSVNEGIGIPSLTQRFQFAGEFLGRDRGECGGVRLPPIPPRREGGLGIGVDQNARTIAGLLSGYGEVSGQGGLPDPSLLAGENEGLHIGLSRFRFIVLSG
ncbi:hypothetical protein BN874_1920015 [Candidatus Contendobacter odensis Run_B_J11]|uniref:Uncharacterized protein n=1 Tax=Candidatus Contendobacter odensis Run_B_J11 TaxID=1400861 RepID=A0A7U7GAU1_9GAMM|nr:hypothetical protein BN874_1920015 [Candidatus Contendobacter odensis Run_B_J11]